MDIEHMPEAERWNGFRDTLERLKRAGMPLTQTQAEKLAAEYGIDAAKPPPVNRGWGEPD